MEKEENRFKSPPGLSRQWSLGQIRGNVTLSVAPVQDGLSSAKCCRRIALWPLSSETALWD